MADSWLWFLLIRLTYQDYKNGGVVNDIQCEKEVNFFAFEQMILTGIPFFRLMHCDKLFTWEVNLNQGMPGLKFNINTKKSLLYVPNGE